MKQNYALQMQRCLPPVKILIRLLFLASISAVVKYAAENIVCILTMLLLHVRCLRCRAFIFERWPGAVAALLKLAPLLYFLRQQNCFISLGYRNNDIIASLGGLSLSLEHSLATYYLPSSNVTGLRLDM